jgi:hypothetical protein
MRPIDADYVKSKLNKSALGGHLHYYVCGVIDDAPTIDAEPIVRCKDCEWWTKQKSSIQGRCAKLKISPTGAWFCANGEKRGADNA